MIVAKKSALFSRVFAGDAARRLSRSFHAVRVFGLEGLRRALDAGPVLVVTNHTAWWDPLVAVFFGVRALRADAYAMMDAVNLARLPFFGKVGAFGVDLTDPTDGARAIRYAVKLLDAPRRLVWIFPQGREVPVTVRPTVFQPGSAEIARLAKRAVVVPGAIRYEMGSTPRPVLWVSFGPELARARDASEGRRAQEAAVTRELDRIEGAIAGGEDDGFEAVLRAGDDRFFRLAQAALAWVTSRRLPDGVKR